MSDTGSRHVSKSAAPSSGAPRELGRKDLSQPEYAQPSEPPQTYVFYRGKRHSISGPPEAAKTLFVLALMLEHYRRGHGNVAFVDFEQDEPTTRLMLEELGATPEEIAAIHYYVADGPPDAAVLQAMRDDGVTLVSIDALAGAYDASGLDDNKRKDAETFQRQWIKPLYQAGIATIALDHVVKNSDSRGSWSIGTERKQGAIDVHIGLEPISKLSRGGRGLIQLTVHKDRPAHLQRPHPFELHLASDPATHRITWELRPCETHAEDDQPPAARKLLDALEAVGGDDGATSSTLVDWIKDTHGHGLKRETVSRTLNRLERDGHIERLNPDALVGTPALWLRVTRVTSHVTSHRADARVTAVTVPLYGHAARSHVAAHQNGDHADDQDHTADTPLWSDDEAADVLRQAEGDDQEPSIIYDESAAA